MVQNYDFDDMTNHFFMILLAIIIYYIINKRTKLYYDQIKI